VVVVVANHDRPKRIALWANLTQISHFSNRIAPENLFFLIHKLSVGSPQDNFLSEQDNIFFCFLFVLGIIHKDKKILTIYCFQWIIPSKIETLA